MRILELRAEQRSREKRDSATVARGTLQWTRFLTIATAAAAIFSGWVGYEATLTARDTANQTETAKEALEVQTSQASLESRPVLFLTCQTTNRDLDRRPLPKEVWFANTTGLTRDEHYDDKRPDIDTTTFYEFYVPPMYTRCGLTNYGRTVAVNLSVPLRIGFGVSSSPDFLWSSTSSPTFINIGGLASGQTDDFIIANHEELYMVLDFAHFGLASNIANADPTVKAPIPVYEDQTIDDLRASPVPPAQNKIPDHGSEKDRQKLLQDFPRNNLLKMPGW